MTLPVAGSVTRICGVAFEAGALVEEAVEVEEAFGVVLGGVGVFGDDFVGVDGGCGEGGEG